MGVNGAKYLFEALKINRSIEELQICFIDLASNKIGNEGTKFIASGLKLNTTLKHFSIADNEIDLKGIESIRDTLNSNNTLEYLDLSSIIKVIMRFVIKV